MYRRLPIGRNIGTHTGIRAVRPQKLHLGRCGLVFSITIAGESSDHRIAITATMTASADKTFSATCT